MEQTITFKLEDFEGPLDLLLYLVSKNKMNIYDIEIVALIDHRDRQGAQYGQRPHALHPGL